MVRDTAIYLTFCTVSFEFKESSLSDTRFLIQDVVLPHFGDKRMALRCTRSSLPNYFVLTSNHWNAGQKIELTATTKRDIMHKM